MRSSNCCDLQAKDSVVSGGKGHVYDTGRALLHLAEQITRSYNTASKIAGNLKAAPIAIALSFWIPIF